MKRVLAVFSLVLFLPACGSDNEGISPNEFPPGSVENPVVDTRAQVCFTGSYPGSPNCFPMTESNEIESNREDYNYRDPKTDPSFPAAFDPELYSAPIRFVDLDARSSNSLVSANFVIGEFLVRRKGRYGVLSRELIHKLEGVRQRAVSPLFITSGYRSPGYNAGIDGAARWSRHQYGDAVDFFSEGASLAELQSYCLELGATFTRVYTSHVHCDWRGLGGDPAYLPSHSQIVESDGPMDREDLESVEKISWRKVFDGTRHTHFELFFEEKFPEDPGEVLVKWKIRAPGGRRFELEGQRVLLPPLPGTYVIQADVGGTYRIDSERIEIW